MRRSSAPPSSAAARATIERDGKTLKLFKFLPTDAAPVRHGTRQLRRLLRTGQAQAYQRVLPGLPVALADPYFRLALARAAARAGLDLFPPPRRGG